MTPKVVYIYIISISVTFSMCLLMFVWIERLVPFRRPHSVNMDLQREKKTANIFFIPILIQYRLRCLIQFRGSRIVFAYIEVEFKCVNPTVCLNQQYQYF